MRDSYRHPLRALQVLVLLFVLAGCSPHYNWRTFHGSGFDVLFPARVDTLTQTVHIGEADRPMTMHAARLDESTFLVAQLAYPPSEAEDLITEELWQSLLGNLKAEPVTLQQLRPDADAASSKRKLGPLRLARGRVNDKPVLLVARFVHHGGELLELAVVGPEHELCESQGWEAIETFEDSFEML